ncbi:DUF998 domain-containing protein [Streptomyces filamentosus]|uniref:DUF998 domain-containing protein n=1 Tax=Streptomyces filamentosus TaxID=67294 RepID=UPI00331D738E
MVAGPLFLAVGFAQGLARDGFSSTRNAISRLALGEAGWIRTADFLLAGVLLTGAAVGLRKVLRGGPGGTWGPVLVGVFGVSFWVAAGFPADAGAGFPAGAGAGFPAGAGAGFPAGAAEETVMSGDGTVHMAGGTVGHLALCAAFVVLARAFAARGLRGWAVACRIVPAFVLAGFMASAASVLAFTLGAELGLLWPALVTARPAGGTTANR